MLKKDIILLNVASLAYCGGGWYLYDWMNHHPRPDWIYRLIDFLYPIFPVLSATEQTAISHGGDHLLSQMMTLFCIFLALLFGIVQLIITFRNKCEDSLWHITISKMKKTDIYWHGILSLVLYLGAIVFAWTGGLGLLSSPMQQQFFFSSDMFSIVMRVVIFCGLFCCFSMGVTMLYAAYSQRNTVDVK